MADLSDAEVDDLLERFDQTEPALQRRIIAKLIQKSAEVGDENERLRSRLAKLEFLAAAVLRDSDSMTTPVMEALAELDEE